MSQSKFKYYEVSVVTLVKANSKRDAIAIAFGDTDVPGEALQQEVIGERVMASDVARIY